MSSEGLFSRFVDDVNVVYNFWNVPISGVFAFYELELSSSLVGGVFDEFAAGPKCVSTRLDKVRSMVCWSIINRKDVFRYGVFWFCCVRFVVLLTLLLWVWDRLEVGGGRLVNIFVVFANVCDRFIA